MPYRTSRRWPLGWTAIWIKNKRPTPEGEAPIANPAIHLFGIVPWSRLLPQPPGYGGSHYQEKDQRKPNLRFSPARKEYPVEILEQVQVVARAGKRLQHLYRPLPLMTLRKRLLMAPSRRWRFSRVIRLISSGGIRSSPIATPSRAPADAPLVFFGGMVPDPAPAAPVR